MGEIVAIWLDKIDPNPYQPRMGEDEEHIIGLAISIARDSLMQIPSARKAGDRYQLLFGHSRLAAIKLLRRLRDVALLSEICTSADAESLLAQAWRAAQAAKDDFMTMPLNLVDASDEGMFRAAIAENEQRKDLGTVERARAMARYRDEFGKSSAEIGELFGKAPETVRGTLRYLELPVDAQRMLDNGQLSQGAARALLSMQRVVSEKVIAEAAKSMAENSERMTPEGVAQNRLSNYAYNMWTSNGWENEKPRAGWKGWPLDMKNFPNRLLPELTKSELPDIFGMQQDTRLLKIIHKAETVVDVSLALGQAEDADLRELAGKVDILLDPPSCASCPLYTRIGGAHYCGLRACHTRKGEAWKTERLANASRELGIAMCREDDGTFQALESSIHKELFDARGPDLRLVDKNRVRGYPSQYNFKGIDTEFFYVVVVGKTLAAMKETRKAERALERAGQKVIRSAHDLVSDKKERLSWEAAEYAGETLFRDISDLGLNLLHGANSYWSESGPAWATPKRSSNSDPYPADFLRRKLAVNMLKKQIGYDLYRMGIAQYAEALQAALVALGLKPWEPHLAEMARVMQAEVDEQFPPEEKPVSAETGS